MAILMVAMLAFGGTYAYFTSTASGLTTGNAKAAKISLAASGDSFTQQTLSQKILPSEYLFGGAGEDAAELSIVDSSNRASYIFVKFEVNAYKVWTPVYSEEVGQEDQVTNEADKGADNYSKTAEKLSVALSDTSKITLESTDGTNVTFTEVKAGSGVYYFISTGTYAEATDLAYDGDTFTVSGTGLNILIPGDWDNTYQEAKIEVSIEVDSCQYVGFAGDVTGAYKTATGVDLDA